MNSNATASASKDEVLETLIESGKNEKYVSSRFHNSRIVINELKCKLIKEEYYENREDIRKNSI